MQLDCDRQSTERYRVDLLAATETQDQVRGGLLLDVVVGARVSTLELLVGKDEAPPARQDSALVLDPSLSVSDAIR